MITFAFLQIPLTRIFPIQGIETFLRHLVLLVGFLGATLAVREKRHINIDVLARIATGRGKSIASIFTNSFAALICTFLLMASVEVVKDSRSFGETVSIFIDIPTWTIQLIFIFGFGLMIFRFALSALESILALLAPRKGGESA